MWIFDYLFNSNLNNRVTRLEKQMSETADRINALNTQVSKIAVEVQNLIDKLASVELPPDAQEALAALELSIAQLDGLNTDQTA